MYLSKNILYDIIMWNYLFKKLNLNINVKIPVTIIVRKNFSKY